MAMCHKWDVKNDLAYVLQFFSLISDGLGGVGASNENYLFSQFGASILPEVTPTDVATPFLVCKAPLSQNQDQKVKYKFCVFCKNNDEDYYPGHNGQMTCENHCYLCQGNKNVVGHNTHSCPKLNCGQKGPIHSNYPYLNSNEFHFDTVAIPICQFHRF